MGSQLQIGIMRPSGSKLFDEVEGRGKGKRHGLFFVGTGAQQMMCGVTV